MIREYRKPARVNRLDDGLMVEIHGAEAAYLESEDPTLRVGLLVYPCRGICRWATGIEPVTSAV